MKHRINPAVRLMDESVIREMTRVAEDLDVIIYPIGTVDPGTYGDDLCGYGAATLDNPETATCELGDAGTYTVEVMHYGTGPTTYTVTVNK